MLKEDHSQCVVGEQLPHISRNFNTSARTTRESKFIHTEEYHTMRNCQYCGMYGHSEEQCRLWCDEIRDASYQLLLSGEKF